MNLKTLARDSKSNIRMSLLFFMLVVTIESLMFVHWKLVLEPRIRVEADANAQIIAESQARLISQSLISNQGILKLNTVNDIMDRTLILKDSLLNEPFFIGVSVEIDPEALRDKNNSDEKMQAKDLFISHGIVNCPRCFSIDVGLYSHISNELIGLAYFQVNDAIFQKFNSDIKNKLFVEAFIVLIIAMLVWYAAVRLVKQLQLQISVRKQVEIELRKAKEQAEAANEAKSQFLANMSHELRTPLNAVIGMSYMVLKGDLSSQQRDQMTKMDSSAHLLLNLINDILDFSKSESGNLQLENINFTVDEVLDNLHRLIVCKAEEKKLDVIFSVSEDVPQNLVGDPLRLGQVLLNLSTNAIKFTQQGTIVISIEIKEKLTNQIKLKFSVTDTGIGLAEHQQKKLFQSFSQVDSSTTRMYGGTGLGLAICKQLTELMQGDIWVDSQLGEGSTFSFTAVFSLGIKSNETIGLPMELKNMPVLVVDDNLVALEVFTNMLKTFSFDVYAASSAEQGMEIVDKMNEKGQPLKLILMDWRLPKMNGLDAARIIKGREDLKSTPKIILITAYTNDEVIDSAREYFDAYLPKPLTHSYLCNSIVTLFGDTANKKIPVISTSETESHLLCPGVKLLLVEDNFINQEVAISILRETKIIVDVANDGFEAIDKIHSHNYDLVLMDIQMPRMDGFEATRAIRKDSKNDQLPIIAMTAHALQKDKDDCLNAGMNDFIAKPFVVDEFFVTIKKWIPKEKLNLKSKNVITQLEENIGLSNSQSIMELSDSEIDDSGIDIKQAIKRFKGDTVLLLKLLNIFAAKKATVIKEMSEHVKNNNWEQAGKIAHGIKGTSGNLCINSIFELSQKLEIALKQQATLQVNELLQQMLVEFELVNNLMQKLSIKMDTNIENKAANSQHKNLSTTIMDIDTVQELVKQLESLVNENNLNSKVLVEELNNSLSHPAFAAELINL